MVALVGLGLAAGWASQLQGPQLSQQLSARGLGPLPRPKEYAAAQIELGHNLFFDKVLSGNRDVSCATCHSPQFGSGDASAVSIGTGGQGPGPQRQLALGHHLSRNSPSLFNKGLPGWKRLFWDGRAEVKAQGVYASPFLQALPRGMDSLLAAQAIFPLTARDEMRGAKGDHDVFGVPNEIADFDTAKEADAYWKALLERVLLFAEYREMFAAAYPQEKGPFTILHLVNALSAYEGATFVTPRAPFALFLAGEEGALTGEARRGAQLFYGKAACANCHEGTVMSDQSFHNLAVPQVGPGRNCIQCHAESVPHRAKILMPGGAPDHRHIPANSIASNVDFGRFLATGKEKDRFAFRTPSLWNVEYSAPYMHNGCYQRLDEVVAHHLDPAGSLRAYTGEHLDPRIKKMVMRDKTVQSVLIKRLDPQLRTPPVLSEREKRELLEFLHALSDPQSLKGLDPPARVPSGLPVAD